MRSHFRVVLGLVVGVSILMVLVLALHVGGQSLAIIGAYSPLAGALIGGLLVLVTVRIPARRQESIEPWLKREQLAWTLIGCGFIIWAIGESFWDYYTAHGQSPFPSLADIGYSCSFPLIFAGLILQPSPGSSHKRVFLILDSLITMGALLSIAWFLLLGPLAQTPAESPLGKFLGLYYPIVDIALLSCIAFLLLRGSGKVYRVPARRISLLVFGIGLSVYAASDFLFNTLQNLGTYQQGNWVDLGWPLGMMTMGMAAYLRRFLPASTAESAIEKDMGDGAERLRFGPVQLLPYLLLVVLFLVLGFNVLSSDKAQQSIRPVLLITTLIVIGLVIIRQIMTMQDNEHLMGEQVNTLKQLEKVYQDVEKRKTELESGVTHLKEIQTRLANGDVRARAHLMGGDLWPLATGLNLMADRMMRSEYNQKYAQKLTQAIVDLSVVLENKRNGNGSGSQFVLPASCLDVPEIQRLLMVMGLRPTPGIPQPQIPPDSSHRRQSPPFSANRLRK